MSDVAFGRAAALLLALALAAFAVALALSPASAAVPSANTALDDLALIHRAIERHHSMVGAPPRSRNELGPAVEAHARNVPVRGGFAVDPWGTPYAYHAPTEGESDAYALYSAGTNGDDDGGRGDDIVSRETVDRKLYPELYNRERGALALFPIVMLLVGAPLVIGLVKLARNVLR